MKKEKKNQPKKLSGVCLTSLIQQMKQDLCKRSQFIRGEVATLLPHAPASRPTASWIPGNASPICLSGRAEMLAFRAELPLTQSRTALPLSRVLSLPIRWLPLPSCSSLLSPGGRIGFSSSCVSVLTQVWSPLGPHPPGPCHRASELLKHSLIH